MPLSETVNVVVLPSATTVTPPSYVIVYTPVAESKEIEPEPLFVA